MTGNSGHVFYWFRRDLRLDDNHGLFEALSSGKQVIPVFIFDKEILDELPRPVDRRVFFIHQALQKIQGQLQEHGSDLLTVYDNPHNAWKQLFERFGPADIYTNRDYEPYAQKRDQQIQTFCETLNVRFFTFKDQVVFEQNEIVKDDGLPYTVYTPYSKKWKSLFSVELINAYTTEPLMGNLARLKAEDITGLEAMGFSGDSAQFAEPQIHGKIISHYAETRDFPAINGTSKLSVHLRFGTISIREVFRTCLPLSDKFINELIWREFYMQILWHFPRVVNQSFKPEYDKIAWRNDVSDFEKWCAGKTGYPIVDAGMRELKNTGYMHNRVRMITASFLTKHLLIDWRWGEAWFAQYLLDFELSSNNGGWQWAAGSGVDAAPYFRIFNPYIQTAKFDPDEKYIKKWVTEYGTSMYPAPMIDHTVARERCLKTYAEVLKPQ